MKTKLVIIAILLTVLGHLKLQAQDSISMSLDGVKLATAIERIEQQTDYQFFYDTSLDTILVSVDYSGASIDSLLTQLLSGANLEQVITDRQVILVHRGQVLTSLPIERALDKSSSSEPKQTVLFAREYLEESLDLTEKVFEIGSRAKMAAGAEVTVAGFVRESQSDAPVVGAFVYSESPFVGTSTDESGFYALSLPMGKNRLFFQSVGLKNTHRNVMLMSNGSLNVGMDIDVIALNEVTVSADRDINVERATMGVTKIDVSETRNLPVLLGERDLMKAATMTSGVQTIGEGASGMNIRGGKADQNLFLLDGAPIYNTSHFFGFFSVFNAEVIQGMELYKSAIPASYGGRLSSVFDISTKEPNKEKFSGAGGIGPVTSRFMLEVPILKERASLMVGARGTYSDYVTNRIRNSSFGNNEASFYDLIGKFEYDIDDCNKLSVTGYHSYDKFQLASDSLLAYSNFSYTNTNLAANWQHRYGDKLDGLLTVATSQYDYDIGYDEVLSQAFNIDFDISEFSVKQHFDFYFDDQHTFNFGGMVKRYGLNPGVKEPVGLESNVKRDVIRSEQAVESALYFADDYQPSDKLSISAGIRYSLFSAIGPGQTFQYEEGLPRSSDTMVDTVQHEKGEVIKTYHGPEFRLSGRYSITPLMSVKASYNRNRQYVHMMLNSASVAPTDIWRFSGQYIAPQIADQFSLGWYRNIIGKHVLELSAEVYYKKLQNLIDFKVGSTLQFNKTIETDLLQGDGQSYGLELSIMKNNGWFTGWANYTLSRTVIRLDSEHPDERINRGEYYPTSYDKPHYLNIVTNYKFTRRYSFSLNMTYSSGRPVTYPTGKWYYQGVENLHYSDRNAFRIPDYFRVDIGLNIEGTHKIKKLAHSFWTFSIYNVLGRDNVYSVFFKVKDGQVRGYKMTVFPDPVPTITYNFSF